MDSVLSSLLLTCNEGTSLSQSSLLFELLIAVLSLLQTQVHEVTF